MFQAFANYLLGSVTHQDNIDDDDDLTPRTTAATAALIGATAVGVGDNSLRLTTTTTETDLDEWVFVDRDSEGNSDVSSVESLNLIDDESPNGNNTSTLVVQEECGDRVVVSLPVTALLTRTSSTTSLPACPSAMEESWFLTPPPCFISTGPIHMETSPLENLLIEHPSMSVYTHHGRRPPPSSSVSAAVTTANFHHQQLEQLEPLEMIDMDSVIVEPVMEEEEDVEAEMVVVATRRMPRVNRVHVLQQQERQGVKLRQAQKVQIKQACKSIQRGHLDRTNKAREVNSRNRRQRRGERSQGAQRSYANNNRKC